MNPIGKLLRPRSIAVVGASSDPSKTAGRPVAYLLKHGYAGDILPVNPRLQSIGALRCWPDIGSLPSTPEVALVLLGAERAIEAVRELSARGTAAAVVLASGFGEIGPDGALLQEKLKAAAGGMRLLGPNTIGLVNLADRVMLTPSGALEMDMLPIGNIAMVSQSGGLLSSLLSRAAARGVGFSALVSTGNEADLDAADFIDHFAEDPGTAAIAQYMEGLRRPEAYRRAALKAARAGKPLVVFKVGRSETGKRSAVSHTGAMAGADEMYDALFRQVGAIRVKGFQDLLDVPVALRQGKKLLGRRIAVVTTTGGAATLVADDCGVAGFELPPPDPATVLRLEQALGDADAALDRNPVDVTLAGSRPDLYASAVAALQDSPAYDGVVAIIGASALTRPEAVADALAERARIGAKPLLCYLSTWAPAIVRLLNERGAPAFDAPESVAVALGALLNARADLGEPLPSSRAESRWSKLSGPLNEFEARGLFADYGVPSVRESLARTPEEAGAAAQRMGGEVVLKVLSRKLPHKTEAGGIVLGVRPDEAAARCETMAASVRAKAGIEPEGFLVQERVRGVEMILGFHRDPQLGPAVLVGLGGVATELYRDTAMRLLPLRAGDAAGMVSELKASALLAGFRGAPAADREALVGAIEAFAAMCQQLGERLREAEINPLFVLARGEGVRAADGIAILESGMMAG
ncbi:MAG: acetate--CoA ligase family protein [Betaproteobacteria bacterium]